MSRVNTAVVLVGAGLALGALSGRAALFVRPWFLPIVLCAGVVLLFVGARTSSAVSRGRQGLLVLPFALALLLPTSAAVSPIGTSTGLPVTARLGDNSDPLAGGRSGSVTLLDVLLSEAAGGGVALAGRPVSIDGVASGGRLTRLVMVCCAADARAVSLPVLGAALPRDGSWVRVAGHLTMSGDRVALRADTVSRIPLPSRPIL